MTIEEAIKTAVDHEERVRDLYKESINKVNNSTVQKIFKVLADEEETHVDYLKNSLKEWEDSGIISVEKLETAIPNKDVIEANIKKLKKYTYEQEFNEELEAFKKALESEIESTNFYKRMVKELPEESQGLFTRLIEIEEGHELIIQAEIDNLNKLGFWFDFMEFNLEAGYII